MNQNIFNHVVKKNLNYAKHNLSHQNLMSLEFGGIYPMFLEQDLVPGDRVRINSAILAKFAPLINPLYAEINVLTEFYFVPYRILQPNYIQTMSGGESGVDYPNRSKIIFNTHALAVYGNGCLGVGSLCDYLGINLSDELYEEMENQAITKERTISFLSYAVKAYNFIYNEYYRDQNVVDPIEIPFDDIDISAENGTLTQYLELFSLKYSAWKKDYFTSALPFAQRGGAQGVPIEGSGEVYYTYVPSPDAKPYFKNIITGGQANGFLESLNGGLQTRAAEFAYVSKTLNGVNDDISYVASQSTSVPASSGVAYDPNGTLRVDYTNAQLLVENIRLAASIQQFFELKARSGGRDREFLFGQFGVDNKDMRLTIPQLIGGGVQNVVMSEILQQSQSTSDSALGTRAGDANTFGSHGLFRDFYVTEPGLIMGVMRVLPKAQYQQGISRHYKKFSWEDDFNPLFQHLGEQEIYSYELYSDGTEADNNVFGYAPRYAEMKWHQSEVHGDFKESLDSWHSGRIFPERPVLNRSFIEVRPEDMNRNFAVNRDSDDDVQNAPYQRIWANIYHRVNMIRPIVKDAIPQLI